MCCIEWVLLIYFLIITMLKNTNCDIIPFEIQCILYVGLIQFLVYISPFHSFKKSL